MHKSDTLYPQQNHKKAVIYMLLASFLFAAMNILTKSLGGQLPSAQIAFFRLFVNLLFVIPFIYHYKFSFFGKSKKLLFARGLLGAISLILGFYAITHIRMADATVLWKTSVLFTAIWSILILKEKVSKLLILLILSSFLGVILIVKPSFDLLNLAALAGLGAGSAVGLVTVSIRKLHLSENVFTIIFSFSFYGSLLIGLLFGWQFVAPNSFQIIILTLIGLLGSVGQLFFTQSFRFANASLVQPFVFSEVIFAAFGGLVFWGELPDLLGLLGCLLIVLSGVGILRLKR